VWSPGATGSPIERPGWEAWRVDGETAGDVSYVDSETRPRHVASDDWTPGSRGVRASETTQHSPAALFLGALVDSFQVTQGEISIDDPRSGDVRALLQRHLSFARSHSPLEDAHALDIDGLLDPAVSFFSFRVDGELLAVAALKRLDEGHAEVKSMHTAEVARGRGIGRAMLDHLVRVARDRGVSRVSLETGSMPAFAPARSLYARAGFRRCGPFGDYRPSRNSTFMTLTLIRADHET
jgi:putative acetyltransferase